MPDPGAVEFSPYATRFSNHARESRKQLPDEYQIAFQGIIDALVDDPLGFPHRTSRITDAVLVYRHPDPPIEVTFVVNEDDRVIDFLHFAATMIQVRQHLFVSYSHEDEAWLKKLKKWLSSLVDEERIDVWDDSRIKAGQEWRKEIEANLKNATGAILLVSQNFLASKFIKEKELPPLLARAEDDGLKILCVSVDESAYERTEIEKYQWLNDPDRPLAGLTEHEAQRELKQILEKIREAVAP